MDMDKDKTLNQRFTLAAISRIDKYESKRVRDISILQIVVFEYPDSLFERALVVDMYSADCARTVVCGRASTKQIELIETYSNIQENVIQNIRPGWKVGQVTSSFTEAFAAKGLGDNWIPGPVHGVGLEFEEWPHPSHYFGHAQLEIGENWTLAVGHSILPVKTVGGVQIGRHHSSYIERRQKTN
jgi:methionine aminopeptidase